MDDLTASGVKGLGVLLAKGDISARAAAEAYLARIGTYDRDLNSFITVTGDLALRQADASDARRRAGKTLGPLDGIPVALKDNMDLAGVPTTAGIAARRASIAPADAHVTALLKAAGAVILGKLNMHEGAHGATTRNEAYGWCHNPHRHGFTPGGSSGGSGAAVAAGLCAAALGSDTLGSIRIPASFCGIAGFKPTFGLVSTRGVLPMCRVLDHVGPMARSTADLALLMDVLADFDADDPTAQPAPRPAAFAAHAPETLDGLRIGRLRDLGALGVEPAVAEGYEAALAVLAGLGAHIAEVSLDGFDHAAVRPKAMLMAEADLDLTYANDLARDPGGFSQAFRDGIAYGRAQTAPKLAEAYEIVRGVRPVFARLFAAVDALATPATPFPAFSFDQTMPKSIALFTSFANHIGAPAAAVPMGKTKDRLPMGLQIVAPAWQDARCLAVAAAYERAAGWAMAPEEARPGAGGTGP